MKRALKSRVMAVALFCLASLGAAAELPTARVEIDPARSLGPVNPMLFGQNIEAGDGTGIFPSGLQPQVIATGSGVWDPHTGRLEPKADSLVEPLAVGSLRYPGGCLVHGFDWKRTIGPPSQRAAGWDFGLDEFLSLCKDWQAEPVITLSDYTGTPQDAADLVEYLNAPADSDHRWAERRAANGHPEPYGVTWFELGNESDHGNHELQPAQRFSPSGYSDYFRARAGAMRSVDSAVRLGLVLEPGIEVEADWNRLVLAEAGDAADFAILHFYAPHGRPGPGGHFDRDELMKACMAAGAQYERLIEDYHALIRRQTGRSLPLAVTEYNIGAHDVDGYAYRFSYAAALMNADLIRVMLPARRGVQMAHYWGLINGYWGMIDLPPGSAAEPKLRPAYPLFRLWGEHFAGPGGDLIDVDVDGPTLDFAGYYRFRPARGQDYEPHRVKQAIDLTPSLARKPMGQDVTPTSFDETQAAFAINGLEKNRYVTFATVRPELDEPSDYRLTFEARFEGAIEGLANLGLGLADDRGWEATKHAAAVRGVDASRQWQTYSCLLRGLPQTRGVEAVLRLEGEEGRLNGTLAIRDLRLEVLTQETLSAYPAVTASARWGSEPQTIRLVLFNKSLQHTVRAPVTISGGSIIEGRSRQIASDDPAALSIGAVAPSPNEIEVSPEGVAQLELPPASMTTLELRFSSVEHPENP